MKQPDFMTKYDFYSGMHNETFFQLQLKKPCPISQDSWWCAYIYIFENLWGSSFKDFWLDEETEDYISIDKKWKNASWHGEVTFYARRKTYDWQIKEWRRSVKIGYDYNHIGDRNGKESFNEIQNNVKTVIDELQRMYNYKLKI